MQPVERERERERVEGRGGGCLNAANTHLSLIKFTMLRQVCAGGLRHKKPQACRRISAARHHQPDYLRQ